MHLYQLHIEQTAHLSFLMNLIRMTEFNQIFSEGYGELKPQLRND